MIPYYLVQQYLLTQNAVLLECRNIYYPYNYSLRVRLGSRARSITSSHSFYWVCFMFCFIPSFISPLFLGFFHLLFLLGFLRLFRFSPFNVFRLLASVFCASRAQYDGMASRCLICLRVLHDDMYLCCINVGDHRACRVKDRHRHGMCWMSKS